jgi:hypothetical protein
VSLLSIKAPAIRITPRAKVRQVKTISLSILLKGINDCVRPRGVAIEKRKVKMPIARSVLFMVDCFRV